ncbi:hypothetical protein PMAYCL1PPCAC_33245, partial [Pristionchus mayeri]
GVNARSRDGRNRENGSPLHSSMLLTNQNQKAMASAPSSSSATANGVSQHPTTSSSSCDVACPEPDVVAAIAMRKAMGALLDNVGFTHAHEGPLNVLTDVAIRFMEKLCTEVKLSGEYCGRSQPAVDDLSHAFSTLKFDQIDFHSYLSQVSSITPVPPMPLFPVDLASKRSRINGYKASREERRTRPPHIPSFLPGIRPSGEEKEDAHVPVASTSTAVEVFETPTTSFEKSKGDYLSRFECDVPGFLGASAFNYGMKKTDKDKNPPVLLVMKGRRAEEERRREEDERSKRREPERAATATPCLEETNGIHSKFKKHKEKDKEKGSRPPSTLKGVGKGEKKEKTPHKIRKEEKSRTSTPIIRDNAAPPVLHPEVPHATPLKSEKMDREPAPSLLNLFDDPAEEADIPLPRTPGRNYDSPDDDPLFFDPDPFGRNSLNAQDSGRSSFNAPASSGRNSFNAPSTSTPIKSTPTITDEERRRKEEKRAKKEERKKKKAAEEAEKEALKEAKRIAAMEESKERKQKREQEIAEKERKEREKAAAKMQQRIAENERRERERAEARLQQQQAEKERKEREAKAEAKRLEELEMARIMEAKKEQIRIESARVAKAFKEQMDKEKEAKEKKRKEERRKEEEKRREEEKRKEEEKR